VSPDATTLKGTGERPAAVPAGGTAAAPERVAILIVDDRQENLLALEAILDPLGQRIVRANSGEEALKRLLRDDFAVILLDVQMPGMNGFETAQMIKSRERSRNIPIIFLTAISKEDEYVFQGYEVGAVDYMSKPFNPDILRSKVSVFIDLYRKQEQLRRQELMLRDSERRELELRHRTELLETEARFAAIVHAAMDAIVTFDGDKRISLFNGAAERMFRRRAADAVGQPVGTLFPDALGDGYLHAICEAAPHAAAGDPAAPPHVESLTGLRGDAELFPLEATVSCLEVGGQRMFTMIARDVSERVKAEAALKTQAISLANTMAELTSANDELNERQLALEQAMTARNRFYASMSHELRTPINAIIGYNTLLLDNIYGPLNEKQTQGLQRTHKAAKHLLELVNDILDLSKIEAGKMELAVQPVSFPGVVEDLFVTVRPLADEHGSELTLNHEGDPVVCVTDPRRVRQILLNLLSNAIKFGRGKPIRIESRRTEPGGVEISVTDQGPGISPVDLPRIFDEFVQLAQPQQHPGGTGLGLPISKRLAALLGGELIAESVVGQGSTFRLVLPQSLDGAKPVPTLGEHGGNGRGARPSREVPRVQDEPREAEQREARMAADARG
jgi:PAS domain S-box-containing protein